MDWKKIIKQWEQERQAFLAGQISFFKAFCRRNKRKPKLKEQATGILNKLMKEKKEIRYGAKPKPTIAKNEQGIIQWKT